MKPEPIEEALRHSAKQYRITPDARRAAKIAREVINASRPRITVPSARLLTIAGAGVAILSVVVAIQLFLSDPDASQPTAGENAVPPTTQLIADLERDWKETLEFVIESLTLFHPFDS